MDAAKSVSLHMVRVTPKTTWTFVALETREGLTGVGEATRIGIEPALLQAARAIVPHVRSVSLDHPEEFADAASPRNLADAAIVSAIDHALWDIYARARGVRLAEVLGGAKRDLVAVYANCNRRTIDRSAAGFAASGSDALRAGFVAFKIAPFDEVDIETCARGEGMHAMRRGLDRVRAVRAVLGTDARLMIDCHWRFDEPTATALIDAVAELSPYWIECPLPERPDNIDALVRLRKQANGRGIRLAGLEEGIGLHAFAPYVAAGVYDVVMPDVKYFAGLRRMVSACEWFASQGVDVSLHNPSGPICHAVSLSVAAVISRTDCLELQFDESPLFDMLIANQLPPRNGGFFGLPTGRGIGVALDPSVIEPHGECAGQRWEFA